VPYTGNLPPAEDCQTPPGKDAVGLDVDFDFILFGGGVESEGFPTSPPLGGGEVGNPGDGTQPRVPAASGDAPTRAGAYSPRTGGCLAVSWVYRRYAAVVRSPGWRRGA
jgi:hypothetical protein